MLLTGKSTAAAASKHNHACLNIKPLKLCRCADIAHAAATAIAAAAAALILCADLAGRMPRAAASTVPNLAMCRAACFGVEHAVLKLPSAAAPRYHSQSILQNQLLMLPLLLLA
jgi:hypothetical protein